MTSAQQRSAAAAASRQADAAVSPARLKSLANPWEPLIAFLVLAGAGVIWFTGPMWWHEGLYEAEYGLGYWLGLIGGVIMLLAYAYWVRKYAKALRFLGLLNRWLKIHIIFGIVGPYMILFHTTFQLQSTNATYAFWSMIAVMTSGVVGRYLYSRVHLGLAGRKVRLKEVRQMLGLEEGENRSVLAAIPGVMDKLKRYEQEVMAVSPGVWAAISALTMTRLRRWRLYRELNRELGRFLQPLAEAHGWSRRDLAIARRQTRSMLNEYLVALGTVARFRAYDQIFMLWRMVHVPLLFLLLLSGIVHVVYVHMY